MLHEYPYTDFHELNLDYIMRLARESMGLHLEVVGNNLQLKNACGGTISDVTIHYSDTALEDDRGNKIAAYVIDGGVDNRHLLLTHGNGDVTTITIPFATVAEKDVNDHDITSYVRGVGIQGDKILVTFGDGSTYAFTVPFANKAQKDENGKLITSYVANLSVANDKLVVKDGNDNILDQLTITYAVRADNDGSGDEIEASYGASLDTGSTTVKLISKKGTVLDEITVPYATSALQDTDGNKFLEDYVETLGTNNDRVEVYAHNGTVLGSILVPYSVYSTDATNAVENVQVVGDQMIFTTFGNQQFTITCPYAVKAQKDDLGNIIKTTYVANVTNDISTGEITFWDATGNEIVTLTPTVNKATHDSYNNLIADYVKSIVVSSSSNYVTVTHGTGNTDSIIIHYAETAWKDTNDQVIKNTYITYMECIEDVEDGHYKLVCYDGDNPKAELFRIELLAYAAQCDVNGRELTTYIGTVQVDPDDDTKILVLDGEGNEVNSISGTVSTTPTGSVSASFTGDSITPSGSVSASASGTAVALTSGTLPSVSYDSNTETLTFNPGVFPTVSSVTQPTISASFTGNSVTPTGSVSASFTGDATTEDVEFTENI